MIPNEAIERRQTERIRELATRFSGFVKEARERVQPRRHATAQKFVESEHCETN